MQLPSLQKEAPGYARWVEVIVSSGLGESRCGAQLGGPEHQHRVIENAPPKQHQRRAVARPPSPYRPNSYAASNIARTFSGVTFAWILWTWLKT